MERTVPDGMVSSPKLTIHDWNGDEWNLHRMYGSLDHYALMDPQGRQASVISDQEPLESVLDTVDRILSDREEERV